MTKVYLIVATFFLFQSNILAQTPDDTLIGVVNQELIKINRNTGGINYYQPINGLPAGADTYKLTWCEPNQCFYFLSQTTLPELAKLDLNGNCTILGALTITPGTLFMCEGISFNRFDGELYVSGSLDGNPNSSPADYYSETLLRVDTTTLTTTIIASFIDQNSNTSEGDAIAFDDSDNLYFYDGQPGQFNHFFKQDMSFLSPPILMLNTGYIVTRDLTVKDDELFFSQNRILKKINIPTLTASNVGTMFTAADFNGEYLFGITWRTGCPSQGLFGNDTSICMGQSITLAPSISGTSYLWQDGSVNPTLNTSMSGVYWVELTSGGCIYKDSIAVSVETLPTISLGNDTLLCAGQMLLLDATSSNGTTVWQDGSVSSTFTVNDPGLYWAMTSNSCGNAYDTILVEYVSAPPLYLGADTSFCIGASILLSAACGADSYSWQDGSMDSTLYVTQPGTYSVDVLKDGCIFSDFINISQADAPIIDLGEDLIICSGKSIILSVDTQNASYEWQNGSSEPSIVVNDNGTYWVIASNLCGADSDTINIASEDCFCVIYIPNSFTPNSDEFNSGFGPVFDCILSSYLFKIYNRWGEVIFESADPYYFWDGTYSGRRVPDGIYTYTVTYSSENTIAETMAGHVNVIR